MTGSEHHIAELSYFIMLIANITGMFISMATPFELQIRFRLSETW